MRKAILIGILAVFLGLPMASAQFNVGDYDFKRVINITNSNTSVALPQNYTINFTFDTLTNNVSVTGDDFRVVWKTTEIDRMNLTPFKGNTTIVFRLQENISAGQSNYDYVVYYGNSSASVPPKNGSNIYLDFCDFRNFCNWTFIPSNGWSVSNGILYWTRNASVVGRPSGFSPTRVLGDIIYEIELNTTQGSVQLGALTRANSNTTNEDTALRDTNYDTLLESGQDFSLYTRLNASFVRRANIDPAPDIGDNIFYKVKTIIFGRTITGYLNDSNRLEFVDANLTSGRQGIDGHDGNKDSAYRNYRVSRFFTSTPNVTLGDEIAVAAAEFNVTIFNEITEGRFNLSTPGLSSTTMAIYCPGSLIRVNVTSNNFILNSTCNDYTEIRLTMNWSHSIGSVYRTLIPAPNAAINFYMIDVVNHSSVFQTVSLDDPTGNYGESTAVVKKVISSGEVELIRQKIRSNEYFIHLVVGEKYTFSVQATGQPTQTVTDYEAKSVSDTARIIRIGSLEYIPDLDFRIRDVRYSMRANATLRTITFTYNDTINMTTSIRFQVFNASNLSQAALFDQTTTPTGPLVTFTYTVPDLNSTYIGRFDATHSTFGSITDSQVISFVRRIFNLIGVPTEWYQIMGLGFIIILALIFGSFHSGVGTFAVALGAAFMYFIGFIDGVVGFGTILLCVAIASISIITNRRGE